MNKPDQSTIRDECAVNKFDTEAEATRHAREWSRDGTQRTVIHGPSETGLAYFVERGDGGLIRTTELMVGHWMNGARCAQELP